jgi:hypothetical protein
MPEAVIISVDDETKGEEADGDDDDDESIDPDQLEEYREELQALGTFPVSTAGSCYEITKKHCSDSHLTEYPQ